MKLGIGAVSFGPKVSINLDLIRRAEALGFDSAWTAEAYGNDAVSTATWILAQTTRIKVGTAIMQMPARTPAMAAMTAMTLDQLSGGRFILGLGPSGPQVVEGWHGVPYGKPLTRTREYIQIIRQILAREEPLEFHGEEYDDPRERRGHDRPRQAAEEHPARQPAHPHLHRVDQPERPALRGRGRRRRLPDDGRSREVRRLVPAASARRASRRRAAARASRTSRCCPASA